MNVHSRTISHVVLLTLGMAASAAALADKPHWARGRDQHDHRNGDYARVVDVDPIVRRVRTSVPEQVCWNEAQPVYGGGGRTVVRSTIVGGVIGAAVGHRVGVHQGSHDPALIVGASLIGAAIGNSIGESRAEQRGEYRQVGTQSVQRCEVNYRDAWAEQVDGYRVTYEYHGRHYTTRMPFDPGRRVRVNVDVRPGYDRYG